MNDTTGNYNDQDLTINRQDLSNGSFFTEQINKDGLVVKREYSCGDYELFTYDEYGRLLTFDHYVVKRTKHHYFTLDNSDYFIEIDFSESTIFQEGTVNFGQYFKDEINYEDRFVIIELGFNTPPVLLYAFQNEITKLEKQHNIKLTTESKRNKPFDR